MRLDDNVELDKKGRRYRRAKRIAVNSFNVVVGGFQIAVGGCETFLLGQIVERNIASRTVGPVQCPFWRTLQGYKGCVCPKRERHRTGTGSGF